MIVRRMNEPAVGLLDSSRGDESRVREEKKKKGEHAKHPCDVCRRFVSFWVPTAE